MQSSSETIGAIAAALAKAQTLLANPEKTLTATIPTSNIGEGERTFQYASLSSGLEIVRKALGGEEIAIIQTTAIEPKKNLIQLTTTLAHASGEWIASMWPVCSADEAANPQRLGAALTYARRYALFTLVGIAGEDDLDAPENKRTEKPRVGPSDNDGGSARRQDFRSSRPGGKGDQTNAQRGPTSVEKIPAALAPIASVILRDRLIGQIDGLKGSEEAADWAHKRLPEKNTLTSADAQTVETRFRERVSSFGEELFPDLTMEENRSDDLSAASKKDAAVLVDPGSALVHDRPEAKRSLAPKAIRLKDKEHCSFVARQPCVVCGRLPSDTHHVRFAQPRALGRKVSDEYTVPVCRTHHRELHQYGDEASWWAGVSIDPLPIALELWRRSRPGNNSNLAAGLETTLI